MHLFYIFEKAKISYEMKTLVPIAEVLIYQKIKPRLFITWSHVIVFLVTITIVSIVLKMELLDVKIEIIGL